MSSGIVCRRRRPGIIGTIVAAVAAAASLTAGPASAADLTVRVTALRSADGTVHVALYDSPDAFPNSAGMIEDRVVPASNPIATFEDLAPGTYAVAVFHDENGNGEFDQGLFGIPLEGYAFSMGARAFFGPPSFDTAAFAIGAGGTTVTIGMTYW